MLKTFIIILIILIAVIFTIFWPTTDEDGSMDFKDWVKNPDMKEDFAYLLEEKQKQLEIHDKEMARFQKKVDSVSEQELQELISKFIKIEETADQREILISKALDFHSLSLWEDFEKLFKH